MEKIKRYMTISSHLTPAHFWNTRSSDIVNGCESRENVKCQWIVGQLGLAGCHQIPFEASIHFHPEQSQDMLQDPLTSWARNSLDVWFAPLTMEQHLKHIRTTFTQHFHSTVTYDSGCISFIGVSCLTPNKMHIKDSFCHNSGDV